MSLQKLQEAFPHEAVPTHYQVRYPTAHATHANGYQVGASYDTDSIHTDLLSAVGRQKELEASPLEGYPTASVGKPHVSAHYADGTFFRLDMPEDYSHSHYSDTLAQRSVGTPHRNLIHSLYAVGRHPAFESSDQTVKSLRDAALRDHDPHAVLAAADAGDEAGMKPHQTEFARQQMRDSGAVGYAADSQLRRYCTDLSAVLSGL